SLPWREAAPRAVLTLTDPVLCGPATLALPQDVQAAAFDYPAEFFESPVVQFWAAAPSEGDLPEAVRAVMAAKRPVITICLWLACSSVRAHPRSTLPPM